MIMDQRLAPLTIFRNPQNSDSQVVSVFSAGLQSDVGIHLLIRNIKENKENALNELSAWVNQDRWGRANLLANAVINDKNPALDSLKLILLKENSLEHVDVNIFSILKDEIQKETFSSLFDKITLNASLKEILQHVNTQCLNDAFRGLRQNITATVTDPANVSNNERYTHAFKWLCSQYSDDSESHFDFRLQVRTFLNSLLALNQRDTEFQYRNPSLFNGKVHFSITKLAPSNETSLIQMADFVGQMLGDMAKENEALTIENKKLKLENDDLSRMKRQRMDNTNKSGFFVSAQTTDENSTPDQMNQSSTAYTANDF
tara:strand:- start:7621 stop:8568 length:948 start_codon:yes stop_codon:yes gene_type:complete